MERYSSVKLSLPEIEEIYLLSFDDGSSTTLIKKTANGNALARMRINIAVKL